MPKEIYFFINYPRDNLENQKEIYFEKKSIKPKCIFEKYDYENKKYNYKKIFKFESSEQDKYRLEFVNGEDRYYISFHCEKQNSFVYEVTLEKGLNILPVKRKISQNRIEYKDKMDFFIKALEDNKEEHKIDILLEDTIDLYSKKKGFSFLIPLFLKIYQNKNLCPILLNHFKATNEKSKPNNMDRKSDLKDYSSLIHNIISEANKLITKNDYDPIDFYGILLCYLNYYDEEHFTTLLNDLYTDKPDYLYDIMLTYSSHFLKPINLFFDFFNRFISYSIKKNDFSIFLTGLTYLKDIETFIKVIENNKVDIYDYYKSVINENNIIKLDKSLELKKADNKVDEKNFKKIGMAAPTPSGDAENNINNTQTIIPDYIENLESILTFSKEKNKVLVNFTNDFWKYILNCYSDITTKDIKICSKLRKIFIIYYHLVENDESLKDSKLRKEVTEYYKNDEFTFILNKTINNYIKKHKELKTLEKLSLITTYNPYYKGDYPKRVNQKIFDLLDLDIIDDDEEFIEDFKKMNFEEIFASKLTDYIKAITSKIKKIENFDAAMKLINIKTLEFKDKYKYVLIFLDCLKKKYDIIKKDIDDLSKKLNDIKLKEETKLKLDKAVRMIVDLTFKNFLYETKNKKFDIFENLYKDLPNNVMKMIFIEIINKYIEEEEENDEREVEDDELEPKEDNKYEEIIEYIFVKIVNEIKDNDDINNIIKIIDSIKGDLKEENNQEKDKKNIKRQSILNKFLQKLIDKNLFKNEDFFALKNIIDSLFKFIKNRKKLIINKEEEDDENNINFKEMMDFIYIKLRVSSKNDIKDKCKSDELNKNCDRCESDKIIFKKREKLLNKILIEFLEDKFKVKSLDKNKSLMEKLTNKFYEEDIKIKLLYELITKGKIENKGEYYENIKKLILSIKDDIINKNIDKQRLEEFLKNDEDTIKKRLSLITFIFKAFDSNDTYEEFKTDLKNINDEIDILKKTKDNMLLYFKDSEKKLIIELKSIIDDSEKQKINDFNEGGKIFDSIQKCKTKFDKVEYIEKVKDFLLFNIIYEMNKGANETIKYENAKRELEEIGKLIKANNMNKLYEEKGELLKDIISKLRKNDKEDNAFIPKLKKFYEIKDEDLIDNLTILFKSERYKFDINSRIFFFDCLNNKNEEWQNKDWNNKLSEYKDLSIKDFNKIKEKLMGLRNEDIYDYKNIGDYNKLFTCLYEKKEAIDYLIEKIEKNENIDDLQNKIDPTNTTVKAENIADTKRCIQCINDMKKKADYKMIFIYIKKLEKKAIDSFINYSKNFSKIMDLDRFYNSDENIYEEVKAIIENKLRLDIYQDSEEFFYIKKNKENVKNKIEMQDLIKIKNKIPPKTETEEVDNDNKDNDHSEINNKENDDPKAKIAEKIKEKSKTLIFFKDLITNLENINEYMKVLRVKGSSLPIKITMQVSNMKDIKYYLASKEKSLKEILDFLSDAKKSYISLLNSKYIENANLRLLYGRQYRSMMKYLEDNDNIDSILRYLVNDIDNKEIKEGTKGTIRFVRDWIKHEDYNKDSLESISKYITSLFFENNFDSLDNFYERIKIVTDKDYKGIYLHKCKKNESMEKFIINLFLDKIGLYPIAQNVLITNKETSDEEIQSFLARAILCNYNILFAVEINDSISKYQQSIMNGYISQYLSIKFKKHKGEREIKKNDTSKYLDSCIVFIYHEENKDNDQINAFLKEIKLLKEQTFENENLKELDKSVFKNIKVITSDICGLGKSGKIKKDIKDNNKIYFYFPLGGVLNKNIIFNKLGELLDKIKTEKNYEKVAIHLDLTDSEEISILNEFFFSFLITKFYTNNEKILYIPKGIFIYIEIPNCFNNYLSRISILNIFEKENITFENMPAYDYDQKTIKTFNDMTNIDSNEGIKDFVEKHIGIKKYSFHQINIFIKLFISQFKRYNRAFIFYSGNKNITKAYSERFSRCTKYFTNGGFAKLLTGESEFDKGDNLDNVDILSKAYDNDLGNINFSAPLIFIKKDIIKNDKNGKNEEKYSIEEFRIDSTNLNKFNNSKDYLLKIKELFNLPNDVENDIEINGIKYYSLLSIIEEKNNNYVITNDNFKKMILLIYRILADVPVIIMGDTGCGKTALITKLNQLLNNGQKTLEIIDVNPSIDDEELCKKMDEKNKIAKEQKEDLWVFFDEINTCPCLSLMTEIFINRTYNGKKLCKNIRLIGACNPYRKRKGDKEKCGLSFSDDNDNELVYLVNPLPQSLLYYVFSFGSIGPDDEKKYIKSIIEKMFPIEEKQKLEKIKLEKTNEFIKKRQTKPSDKEKLKEYENELIKLEKDIKIIERELEFHDITTEAISQCHKYLRKNYDDSVVSLREIARFPKLVDFFLDYFKKKNEYLKNTAEPKEPERTNNEKNNKIRSIICSIYLCYYIRLTDDFKRSNFELELKPILLKLVSYEDNKCTKLIDQINIDELKTEIDLRIKEPISEKFSEFLKVEQDFLIKQIKPDKGIGKNALLKENVFLLFVSIITNIPLIIIGKPGTGKSLSVQLLNKSSKGEYSNNKFFKLYPKLIQTYFQGSLSTETKDVENLFIRIGDKLTFYKKLLEQQIKEGLEVLINLPISMACFDELGLAERSKNNPLKALHPKLDFAGKKPNESFVGISNYSLDAAKLNRALVSSVPDLDGKKDELSFTAKKIVKGICPKIKEDKIFDVLSYTYFEYKQKLQLIKELMVYRKIKKKIKKHNNKEINEVNNKSVKDNLTDDAQSVDDKNKSENKNKGFFEGIKENKYFKSEMKKENKIKKDFHGNRDFYNLIKGVANSLRNLGELQDSDKVEIIAKYIERNFGGIEYEIYIDFDDIPDDISKKSNEIKKILQKYGDIKKKLKLNSIFLFKELYNTQCDIIYKDAKDVNLKIGENDIKKYNLNNDINDNINEINSRYLLLEIDQQLTPLIIQNIKLENPLKEGKIKLYDGSPFPDDDNNDYRFMKISEIRDDAKDEKLIIIENLNQIHAFLYDLYNMNYEIIDEEKYARICLDSFRELKTLVNDKFRIIIIIDKRFVNKLDLAFLNRLEKMYLSFDNLLDEQLLRISREIIESLDLKERVSGYENANYSLEDLLINCDIPNIQGLVYYYSKKIMANEEKTKKEKENNDEKLKNDLKEIIIDKIYKILPQDIISILSKNNKIKQRYDDKKKTYNFISYLEDMTKDENKDFTISIIYTFTSIANNIEGLEPQMSFMISKIKSEKEFKNTIEYLKKNNENPEKKYIYIKFEQSNSQNIKYICNYILNNFNDDYKYIIIIHIIRNFNKEKNNNTQKEKQEKQIIDCLPDINPNINQIFIDNLNGKNNISLKSLLDENESSMANIMDSLKDELKLDDEFDKVLSIFLKDELEKKLYDDENKQKYLQDIIKYMNNEKEIKQKIIEIAYQLNDNFGEEDKSIDIIDIIHKKKLINKFTVDIVTCLTDYIKEEVFIKNLKNTFMILEDNNILTTIIEVQAYDFEKISKDLIKEIIIKYLNEKSTEKNNNLNCKFLFNYNIPGFYNFFIFLSNYINKNIASGYFITEKKIRKLRENDYTKISELHEKEESFINLVIKEISDKSISDAIEKIIEEKPEDDIILKDYITYYLSKYRKISDSIYKIDDIYHKIIYILLKLRFTDDNEIIKSNDKIKIQLLKIIWIESNVNYILNILKIIDEAKNIFDGDENKLYDTIEDLYKTGNIKYITNEKKNLKVTNEVNGCFYILLAIICCSITSDKIKKEKISHYYSKLVEINKILQNLNDDLLIFLNEMYIIDELIKLIEIFKKNNNINKINELKEKLRDNAEIIQRYANTNDLSDNLISNFERMYDYIIKDKDIYKEDFNYYCDKLRYILFKEIKKNNDINYRCKILEKLLENEQMVKKSNDIFQIILKNYLIKENIPKNVDNINNKFNDDDKLINIIDKKLNNNIILEETLLYLFEKNSLNYFKSILNNNKDQFNFENEPLDILKDCIGFLEHYISNIKDTSKIKSKAKDFCKIFCLGYIKTYCYTMFKNDKPKCKNPSSIINYINNGKSNIYKNIRLYIYKIFYNNYKLDFVKDEKNINKYGLNKLKKYKDFIKTFETINNSFVIEYKVKTLKEDEFDYFNKEFKLLEKNSFNRAIIPKNYNIIKTGIDNFYMASYNSILVNLLSKNTDFIKKFYENICKPLFNGKGNINKLVEIIYNPNKFSDIRKEYNINLNNMKPILYGYRYCLNELSMQKDKGIYISLYDTNKIDNLGKKYYPGNDTKLNKIYFDVIDHFKSKPEEGCFVCLCDKLFYHSVPSGFPGENELNMTCPRCQKNIGAIKKDGKIKTVKRDVRIILGSDTHKYVRIFKNKEEMDNINQNKLDEIDYMTLDEFKEKYMKKSFEKEKGIFISDKNSFKNDKKVVRNLSQISYRILNYILYSHLFFAKLITGKKEFDKYLPKGMKWEETLKECWDILKKELLNIKIDSIEKFMNYIFIYLFPILNKEETIDNYDKLIEIEKKFENKIRNLIKDFENNVKDLVEDGDKNSLINLLTEKYGPEKYKEEVENYPFYEFFYYTNYLDDKSINEKLNKEDVNQYSVLKMYLENRLSSKSDKNKEKDLFDNIYKFNNALNIINQKYFNNISIEEACNLKLKDTEIYRENKKLLDEFIEFYNNINLEQIKHKPKLSIENKLNDFFIHDENEFGKIYKIIYNYIIKSQNERIKNLYEKKGIYDLSMINKVNVQQLDEDGVFNLKLPHNISFLDIIFNFSYRKILDLYPTGYNTYREYVIYYDLIENTITDLLLFNKQLLNDNITDFIYNNELFSNQITNSLTLFKTKFKPEIITLDDKVIIYKYCQDNTTIHDSIIKDFFSYIKYLNNYNKENNEENIINDDTIIEDIVGKIEGISEYFINLFKEKSTLTVNKTLEIFDYYLKNINEDVLTEIKSNQEDLDEESLKIMKEKIDKFYNKSRTINKEDLAYALRLFITLVLFLENDKENKIKLNKNNAIKYLKSQDLWKKIIINDEKFLKDFDELKSMKIPINQIIYFYESLGKDIPEDFFKEVIDKIEEEKEENNENNGGGLVDEENNNSSGRNSVKSDDDDNDGSQNGDAGWD